MKLKRILSGLLASGMLAGYALFPNAGAALDISAAAAGDVVINASNFPDANFRTYVSEDFDKNKNGILSESEISSVREIKLFTDKIESVKGIEFFTSLRILTCCGSDYDAAEETAAGKLTTLNLSKNRSLTELDCCNNRLTSLELGSNTALKKLCCDCNDIASLDLRANTALEEVSCKSNRIDYLDVSGNTRLNKLNCPDNQIESLVIGSNSSLTWLDCSINQLTSLDASGSLLKRLDCGFNRISTLDVGNCMMLQYLDCTNNRLSALDISGDAEIAQLYCSSNRLTELDLSKNEKLTSLETDTNIAISGVSGTYPEEYAKKHNIKFIDVTVVSEEVTVYRLYNTVSLEHLFTTDTNEVRVLVTDYGWTYEGSAWIAPKAGIPVYRLYCVETNAHLYTTDLNEKDTLKRNPNWTVDNGEQPVFYSDAETGYPIYRVYNEDIRRHHLTTDKNEYNSLVTGGWNGEGMKFYCTGLGSADLPIPKA